MINAHLGISYLCNMKCSHCYISNTQKQIQHPFNGKFILERLSSFGTVFLTYTMGEPLLHPEFYDTAKNAKALGFYQRLMTNGSLITTQKMVFKLIDIGIRSVGVSIDSASEKTHDQNRKYNGSYKLAINALKLLASNSNIKPSIATTINNKNLNDIHRILEIGLELGINSFSFLWERQNGKIQPIDNFGYYSTTMKSLIKKSFKEKIDIHLHDFRLLKLVDEMYLNKEISQNIYERLIHMNKCHAMRDFILIDPNGDMYKCNFLKTPFANIYTTQISDIIIDNVCKCYCEVS